MKEKLIKLLSDSDILCDYCSPHGNSYCIEALAEYLANNGVTILDKTETPKIAKSDFSFDSKMGWFMTAQLQWMGHKWFLCHQIPNEPTEYINALIKQSMKEE